VIPPVGGGIEIPEAPEGVPGAGGWAGHPPHYCR